MGKLCASDGTFWIGLVIIVGIVALLMILIFVLNKKKTKNNILKNNSGVQETKNVRYSIDTSVEKEDGSANISLTPQDVTLVARRTYTVSKDNKVIPGQYTILSTNEAQTKINIRVNGLVREFEHNTKIVLSEGETISPVSCSIVLR